MKLLEFFAGSRSVAKAAQEQGFTTLSTDITHYPDIDIVGDLLHLPMGKWKRFGADAMWFSPPCTGFSVASIGTHWTGGRGAYLPKTSTAALGMALAIRCQEIIAHCQPKVWFIENPRGVMRKMKFMENYGIRHTVSYCQYGDPRMKPTDIWTNCTTWTPKPICKNGDPCHEAAPRGSKTGTQGRDGAHERGRIPHALCLEMMQAARQQVGA